MEEIQMRFRDRKYDLLSIKQRKVLTMIQTEPKILLLFIMSHLACNESDAPEDRLSVVLSFVKFELQSFSGVGSGWEGGFRLSQITPIKPRHSEQKRTE